MAERTYGGMFLFEANKYSRDPGGVTGRLTDMIEKCGGEVLASRLWAEQKLAYQINGQRKGAYWLTYIKMDTNRVAELNRAAQLNGDILRNMLMSVDARLAGPLVQHATTGGTASSGGSVESKSEAKEKTPDASEAPEATPAEAAGA